MAADLYLSKLSHLVIHSKMVDNLLTKPVSFFDGWKTLSDWKQILIRVPNKILEA